MDISARYPGLGHAIILTIVLLGLQLFASFFVVIAFIIVGRDFTAADPLIVIVANVVAFSVVLLWVRLWGRRPFGEFIPLRPFRPIILLPLVPLLLGLGIAASEADNVLRYFLPVPEFLVKLLEGLRSGGIAPIVATIIVAPSTEEFLFRGVFLGSFLTRYSFRKALLWSAILFTLSHLNPYQFFSAFVTGLAFGWLFQRTRSLWPCVIAHALYNAQIMVVPKLLAFEIPGFTCSTAAPGEAQFQPVWLDAIGLVLLAIGIVGLAKTLPADGAHEGAPGTVGSGDEHDPVDE